MAYLKKEQYEYRRESAAKRNLSNEEIATQNGMSEEQAELISKLCSMRHELHCNIDSYVESNDQLVLRDWNRIEEDMIDAGLPALGVYNMMTDIDDIDGLMHDYGEDVPDSDSDDFQGWYDDNYNRIAECWSDVNKTIEDYLAEIDKRHGTSWCPTGALRNF